MLEPMVALRATVILRRMVDVLRVNAAPTIAAFVLLLALNVVVDQADNGSGTNLLANIISFVASYFVQRIGLERLGLRASGAPGRFGAIFGLNFLSGLGIVLGLIALVVPGIILTVRWWAADPIVLAEPIGVDDALRRSWRATRTSFWPILRALAAITVPFVAIASIGGLLANVGPLAGDVLVNAAVFGWLALTWTSQLAVYSLLKLPDDGLKDVFA